MEPRIVTARYHNRKLADRAQYAVIRSSVGAPRWMTTDGDLKAMWPERAWLDLPLAEYKPKYLAKLEQFGVLAFAVELERLRVELADRTLVLCCYEDLRDPSQWCHRRMFAEWFTAQHGYAIDELEEAVPVEKPAKLKPPPLPTKQGGLF